MAKWNFCNTIFYVILKNSFSLEGENLILHIFPRFFCVSQIDVNFIHWIFDAKILCFMVFSLIFLWYALPSLTFAFCLVSLLAEQHHLRISRDFRSLIFLLREFSIHKYLRISIDLLGVGITYSSFLLKYLVNYLWVEIVEDAEKMFYDN